MHAGSHAVGRRLLNVFALLVLAVGVFGSARADEPAETVLLVAKPELGADFSHTVVIARRLTQERYIGVILNRPTPVSLAAIFPDHEASKKVVDPLHFGGPVAADTLFALVRTKESPGEGSLQLGPDLFLATSGPVIDGIIERRPDQARFYAGLVIWEPGELAAEVRSGFWFVGSVDTDVVFKKRTEGLWEDLVQRSRAVTASLPLGTL